MNIILINLTRFGDLLQSQAAIRALARLPRSQFFGFDSTAMPSVTATPSVVEFNNEVIHRAVHESANAVVCGADEAVQAASGAALLDTPPVNRICLVCLANFASTGALLDELALTKALPRDGFLEGLVSAAQGQPGCNWMTALAGFWEWRAALWQEFKPDLVCNLTPTVPARLLARYLASGVNEFDLTGFGIDNFGFSHDTPWGAFLQGSSHSRAQSPFNVVDLFRAVAGSSRGKSGDAALRPLAAGQVEAMRQKLTLELAAADAAECKGFIGFQLGASAERRRWPLEYFAWLGMQFWSVLRLVPILLGSGGESELAGQYAVLCSQPDLQHPHISLVGRTGLDELSAALGVCTLLVSNDTGTLHLAAGLKRPVLGIFLATAQPWDTGPSQAGSLCLEPDLPCHPCGFTQTCPHDFRCRVKIRPETVWQLAHGFIRTGCWPKVTSTTAPDLDQDAANSSLGAVRSDSGVSRIWLTGHDEYGFLCLESLSGHDEGTRARWFMEQRDFLRQFLDRDPLAEFHYRPPHSVFQFPIAEREKLAAELELAAAQIKLLLEQGALLQRNPLPVLRERFLLTVARIAQAFEQSAYLGVLGFLWRSEVQEQGGDLPSALRCAAQYHSLCSGLLERVTS